MGRKKNLRLLDDEKYSLGTEVSEGSQVKEDNNMACVGGGGGKKKGRKGNLIGAQVRDEEDGVVVLEMACVGKKPSKGSKKGGGVNAGFELLVGEDIGGQSEEGDDISVISFNGKKKSSKKSGSKAGFALLEDGEGDDDNVEVNGQYEGEDEPVMSFTGKKKSKGLKKGVSKRNSALLEVKENDKDGVQSEEEKAPSFVGMQKSSKSLKKAGSLFSASVFDAVGDNEEQKADDDHESFDNQEHGQISFTGKKKSSKSSKKSDSLCSAALLEDKDDQADFPSELTSVSKLKDGEDADMAVVFTGNKKSSQKKGSSAFSSWGSDVTLEKEFEANNEEVNDSVVTQKVGGVVAETLKNKKKKKKGGRTAEEEDDLDKILAELGEGPTVLKSEPVPVPRIRLEKVDAQPELAGFTETTGEKEGEDEGTAESAAGKKKKRKKEKDKEKKDTKINDKVDKKLPKHVREIQEALARRKEAEERQKKEDEERLRKEEEEQRKQEELARQIEEAKLRKNEIKQEKHRQLLTQKQDKGAHAKRPIYTKKKPKPSRQTNNLKAHMVEPKEIKQGAIGDVEFIERKKGEEMRSMDVEEKVEVVDEVKDVAAEEEEEESDNWDAKSWDDTDFALPVKRAFENEEADSVAQSIAKKEVKQAAQLVPDTILTTAVGKPSAAFKESDSAGKNRNENPEVLKDKPSSDTQVTKSEGNLRSPICCIMGHVDTGKTKLLDCIRGTNVQGGEAGGITQQIGATYFPAKNLRERTRELKADATLNVPGLLVIDTPGHDSFTNLRSRGSGLCDIAILVVDIMHGLERQTIESLNLLKMRNTEFIVALNKVDRLYGWKTCRNAPIVKAMKQQSKDVQNEFNKRLIHIITQFKEQGLNTELYYAKKDLGGTFNIVPTSAISGEGIPDLLLVLVQRSQKMMIEKLTFRNEVQCTVLEVKVVEGHGTTIDVILVNGVLHEGDRIVVCGMQVPIVTTIRALLTPHPMKELRVKGTYLHYKEIKAAQGIRITAQGLEDAIAGTGLYVVGPDDDVEEIKKLAMAEKESVLSRIDRSGEGVCVQASTLGSLEALLDFLKSPAVNIPVRGISIGPVHKKDVIKASVMLKKKKEFATILAFDVKVTPEARLHADLEGVKIFMADIIYHLFDQFKAYIDNIKEKKKREAADSAVFPCLLKILPDCIFSKKDPIVLGVDVLKGVIKMGTPLCFSYQKSKDNGHVASIPSQEFIDIGRVASIENNLKPVNYAKKGQKVAIKIVGSNPEEQQRMYGRHFDITDELVSHISRKSIDVLEEYYRDDDLMTNDEWKLLVDLKKLFEIQ